MGIEISVPGGTTAGEDARKGETGKRIPVQGGAERTPEGTMKVGRSSRKRKRGDPACSTGRNIKIREKVSERTFLIFK